MKLPTYFLSHGGGPWSYMSGPMRKLHAPLEASLREVPGQFVGNPTAVLMVSAHWEAPGFTVMGQEWPGMVHDYHGFPPHTYEVRYRAPGSPALAQRVQQLAGAAGLRCTIDVERGFDHGAFVPLSVIYPRAEVPVVQLSLDERLDPRAHLVLGRSLSPLRDEGVLIIGSGMSFHGTGPHEATAKTASTVFDDWLAETLLDSTGTERAGRIAQWADAPSARHAHSREEHLLPLMVALGAGWHDTAIRIHHEQDFAGDIAVSSYRFDSH